jgi:hypothetical protein
MPLKEKAEPATPRTCQRELSNIPPMLAMTKLSIDFMLLEAYPRSETQDLI